MLQEEVQKALQEGRPVPPEGFEERSTAQVLRLTSEEKAGRRLPRVAVVCCVLLLVLGIATALASTVESINARLYSYWPELAELLMPVNAGCESRGIRMEVESAVVRDNQVIITYSMEDLEEDRLNKFTAAGIDPTVFPLEDTRNPSIDSASILLSYDPEIRKAVFAQSITYSQPVKQGDYRITLRVPSLTLMQVVVMDLHELLEQYGENPATMPASQVEIRNISVSDRDTESLEVPETLKLLDYTVNPEIRIQEHAVLSGIGWIDGLLHVQLHYTDNDLVWITENVNGYYPVRGHVLMQLADGWSPWYKHRESLPDGIFHVSFGSNEDWPEWEEYIFPCTPDEVREGTLEAQITLNDTVEVLTGDWVVEIPLRMIRYE